MYTKYITFLALTQGLTAKEKLVFDEEFKTLDTKAWKHSITMSGAGNGTF
jgi:hypothetical protein